MSVACDFCGALADRHDETVFVAAPSKLAHICEECVAVCAGIIAERKNENNIDTTTESTDAEMPKAK